MPRLPLSEALSPARYPRLSFPDADWAWFVESCGKIGVAGADERRGVIEGIYSHMVGVNEWLNLTRITAPREYLKMHVLDSLTALPEVSDATATGDLCLDLGSGAGYPGLPLMLWLPDRRWVLADSRGKKAAFLAEAVKLTGCAHAEARAFRGREAKSAARDLAGRCRVVLARAVGAAQELLPEAAPLLARGGELIVLAGPSHGANAGTVTAGQASRGTGGAGFSLPIERRVRLEPEDPERFIVRLKRTQ